jgi:hypothetical protein
MPEHQLTVREQPSGKQTLSNDLCFMWALSSNLGRDVGYVTEGFCGFLSPSTYMPG